MRMKNIREIARLKKRLLLVILALALSNAGLYAYMAGIQSVTVKSLQDNWFKQRSLNAVGTVSAKAVVYAQGRKDLEDFMSRIPEKPEFARVVGELFDTAANNGLTLRSIGYKPHVKAKEKLMYYDLSLNLSGGYAPVKSFLADVLQMREIVTINSVSLNSENPTSESVDLKIHMSAYFRTEEQ